MRCRGSSRSRPAAGAVSGIALIRLNARVRLSVAESLVHLSMRIIPTLSPPDLGATVAEPATERLHPGHQLVEVTTGALIRHSPGPPLWVARATATRVHLVSVDANHAVGGVFLARLCRC